MITFVTHGVLLNPLGKKSDMQNVANNEPDEIKDDVSEGHRLAFKEGESLARPLAREEIVTNNKRKEIRNGKDEEEIKLDCLHHVTMKQGMHSPLEATPRAVQASNQLEGTLRHEYILHRVKVVKCNTSHHT